MTLDGLTLNRIVMELNHSIVGGKIEKIYQPEREEIVLLLHTKSGKKRLVLSANGAECRIHLTERSKENPVDAPNFCMLLRKYLSSGRILSVCQYGLERIVEIEISSRDEMGFDKNYKLICEIMGKYSNIMLVLDDKIVDSIKRVPPDMSSIRQVLPGVRYSAPPMDKLNPLYEEVTKLAEAILSGGLCSLQGISRQTEAEILHRCGIGDMTPAFALIAASRLKEFIGEATQNPRPVLQKNMDGLPVFFSLVPYETYSEVGRIYYKSANELLDGYYTSRYEFQLLKQKKDVLYRQLKKDIARVSKKLKIQLETLAQADNAEKYRLYGELLSANIYAIEKGMKSAEVFNYYTGENVKIPLDEKLSPAANVQAYFKKVGKLKKAKEIAQHRAEEYEDELNYLETQKYNVDLAKDLDDLSEVRAELIKYGYIALAPKEKAIKRKDPLSKPLRFRVSDGFNVFAGRNSRQNDALTMHVASDEDIWFHAKNMPGSHVILFTEGRQATDAAIVDAANIAASLSAAKSGRVEIDYTQRKNIWKPNGAKPGMVLFKNQYSMIAQGGQEVLKQYAVTGEDE